MKAGVVGSPIEHSLSPVMHRAAYAQLGLDWSYEAHEIRAGELEDFVETLDEQWRGLSVTMPGKREAAELAGDVDDVTARLGVANTLVRSSARGWDAHNTDVPGAENALRTVGVRAIESMRVVGAGATASSMILVASRLGAERVELVVRDRTRAMAALQLAQQLGLQSDAVSIDDPVLEPVDLLVSTAPGAPFAGREHEFAGAASAVFDVIYDPWPSALLESARMSGLAVVSGVDLLAHQGALQVHLMTGELVDPDLLHAAALTELTARGV